MNVDFGSYPLGVNLALFATAAVFVWLAGTRLARYADAIGARTALSAALLGMVMLGVATSLPELATTVTAAVLGNAHLVTGNLFGGVALQIAVLAIVDAVAVRGALTWFTPQPVLLFQGIMLLLLLSMALAGAALGEPLSLFGIGLTSVLLASGYVLTVWLSQRSDYLPRWRATAEPDRDELAAAGSDRGSAARDLSNVRLYSFAAAAALVILAAGWTLASAGDALAEQTGLGATFVGVTLVAASTSLPELSTTIGAVRQGNYEMAVSNILGTNCLEVGLFVLADAVYRGGPILAAVDSGAVFAAAMGLVVTTILLLGLLERRDRTILGMGFDSLLVLIAYAAGVGGLYYLR